MKTDMEAPAEVLLERLKKVKNELAEIAAATLIGVDDDALCQITEEAEAVGRLIDATRVTAATEVDYRSRHELGSEGLAARLEQPKAALLLEKLTRVSNAEIMRRLKLGKTLRPSTTLLGGVVPPLYPEVADAVRGGSVGVDAAAVITRSLEDTRRVATVDDIAVAEQYLVGVAERDCVDLVAVEAKAFREALDPDGAAPRDEEARIRRGIRLGRESHGVTPISGGLDAPTAALLRAAFDDANAPGAVPRFLSEHDTAVGSETVTAPDGTVKVVVRDTRTRWQRQHDTFGGLITAGIRSVGRTATNGVDGSGAAGNGMETITAGEVRSTATFTGVVLAKDLEAGVGVGWIDGMVDPISVTTIQRLLCDGGYRKAVLGDNGEVLYLGRARYEFSAAQRRALAVRDGGCVKCGAPPQWCDAHHVKEYRANGGHGKTDIDNGVLLCGACHTWIHTSAYQMKMIHGRPWVLAPYGIDPLQQWTQLGRPRFGALERARAALKAHHTQLELERGNWNKN